MKHAENCYIPVGFDQVSDTIMPVEQHAHIPFGIVISVADFRVLGKHLYSIIDAPNNPIRRRRIIL